MSQSSIDPKASMQASALAKASSLEGQSPWAVFFVACTAVFLVAIDSTVLFAAFSALRAGFPSASAADLSWVLNAYTVVYAALLVPAGKLSDALGRKRIFQLGLLVFVGASAACGAASSVAMLVAARVAQAIGAALLTPASLALVLAAFPLNKRAVVVSLWGAVGGLAAVVDAFSWRWAFYLNLPIGLIAWWQGRARLVEGRDPSGNSSLDLVGIVLLIVGVGALAFGVVEAEGLGWRSPNVVGAILGGILVLSAFVVWARRAANPAVDLTLFDDRTYREVNLASLCFGMAFSMMFFAMFFFLTQVWNYSLPRAGTVAVIAGRIASRVGHRPLLVAGSLLYAAGGLWMYLRVSVIPDYVGVWLPGLLMTGTAVGMVLPSLSGAAVAGLVSARFGIGSAVNQAIRQMGSVLGVALTVALVGQARRQISDFQTLYIVHIALAMLTALLCMRVDTKPRAQI